MAPPPQRRGSFGGHKQPKSGTQTHQPPASFYSGHADSNMPERMASLSSASANISLQDEDFPELGKVDTFSPSASGSSEPPKSVSRHGAENSLRAGSFSRVQTENVHTGASEFHVPSATATSPRHVHYGADREDKLSIGGHEESSLLQKASLKNKRKGPARRQAADVRQDMNRGPGGQDRIYFLGRLLTLILRHRASELKLQVRNDGYVVMGDLLKLDVKTRQGIPLHAYTEDDVMKAVERDTKQRFTLLPENGLLLIRANQGHSIQTVESDKLLKPVLSSEEIPVCVHGTLMSNLDSILKTGLNKMRRNHVHFATGLPRENGVISGMRHTSEVLIYLDSKKALQDGMKLYMSANRVVLTEGFDGVVPPEYFEKIVRWNKGTAHTLRLKGDAEV